MPPSANTPYVISGATASFSFKPTVIFACPVNAAYGSYSSISIKMDGVWRTIYISNAQTADVFGMSTEQYTVVENADGTYEVPLAISTAAVNVAWQCFAFA